LLSAGLVSIHFAKLKARRRDQAAQRMLRKVASVPRDAVKVAIRNSPRQGVLGLQVRLLTLSRLVKRDVSQRRSRLVVP